VGEEQFRHFSGLDAASALHQPHHLDASVSTLAVGLEVRPAANVLRRRKKEATAQCPPCAGKIRD
jgi:hypothetical protein